MSRIERRNSPDLSAPPGYSHVTVSSGNRLVTPAGAVPLDAEGNLVGEGDFGKQTEQCIRNLEAALAAGGATPGDVVKTTVYVVPNKGSDMTEVWKVVQESDIAEAASTLLGVSMLGYAGQRVEIEAIAVLE